MKSSSDDLILMVHGTYAGSDSDAGVGSLSAGNTADPRDSLDHDLPRSPIDDLVDAFVHSWASIAPESIAALNAE